MQTVIEIDGRIVVTDILTERFCCNLSMCKGMCCVEGNAGAPLEEGEAEILEKEYDNYSEYLTPAGRRVIEEGGFCVLDEDGDITTPLIGDADCAYAFRENGVVMCALERAAREGRMDFRKPLSCHLYPIRVTKFGDGSEGLMYHRWDVCDSARECGLTAGMRVYQTLKEPIIRKFGEEFYREMDAAATYINEEYLRE